LELEWRGGAPEGLHDLARRLVDAGARIGPLPKSGRGRLLARGEPAAPVRATTLALPPDATLEDLIAAATRACIAQFVGNWPALQETGAVEAIHQARVALRRLRSMLATVQKALPAGGFAPFRAEAKRIASAMGPARDLDSFIALVSDGPAESFPDDASFEALLAAARSRRAAAAADAQALIAAADTSRFVLDLDAFVERRGWRNGLDVEALGRLGEPAAVFAAATLDRLDRRARKRGKKLRELPPEARHEVRIALKNLRYGADFFAPLFDAERDAKAFAKSLSRLQDVLGAYNDSVVARGVAGACEAEAGPAASRAAGAVCGWCARGVVDADETLLDAWKRYRKAPRFWR
ncbi:MAG TPA: CHAD domain-containing protein, partial [Beijerinckiaceae bacterium]